MVNKIQTVHANRNYLTEMTDDNILYLCEYKKETKAWFRLSGNDVPLEGKRFGLIRSIRLNDSKVKGKEQKSRKVAERDKEYNRLAKNYDNLSEAEKSRVDELVREAAKDAGYDSPLLYHRTDSFGFTKFDLEKMDDGRSIFATSIKEVAATYSGASAVREISDKKADISKLNDTQVADELNKYVSEKRCC